MRGHEEIIAEVTWIAGKSHLLCGNPNQMLFLKSPSSSKVRVSLKKTGVSVDLAYLCGSECMGKTTSRLFPLMWFRVQQG